MSGAPDNFGRNSPNLVVLFELLVVWDIKSTFVGHNLRHTVPLNLNIFWDRVSIIFLGTGRKD